MKAYICHGMTGRSGEELLRESMEIALACRRHGIIPLDPVISEGVQFSGKAVCAPVDALKVYWKRDKEMVKEAHVLIDATANRKSEGSQHETGLSRYFLWKPTIRVSNAYARNQSVSVANLEDDLVVANFEQAAYFAQLRWGSKRKRIIWRLKLLNRCLLGFIWDQIREFK